MIKILTISFFIFALIPLSTALDNQSVSPYITDIMFEKINLTDEKGNVKIIITTTNISIYNPNPIAFSLEKISFDVSVPVYYEDGKMKTWKYVPSGIHLVTNQITIKPKETYIYSHENKITDSDTVQYLLNNEPKLVKIIGSIALTTNENGWSPAYFQPTFDTKINVTKTKPNPIVTALIPTSTSILTSTQEKPKGTSGFEIALVIAAFCVIYIFRQKRR